MIRPSSHGSRPATGSSNDGRRRTQIGLARTRMTNTSEPLPAATRIVGRPTLAGHVAIARIDHWFKNVFILPGAVAAWAMDPQHVAPNLLQRFALGIASVCLVASSNYVINEVLDAPSDLSHPIK